MARIASTALVVALLAATATAFALTEGLKLQPSPILSTRVDKLFSPVCDCDSDTAAITFRLREADTVELRIVRGGRVVRTIVPGREYERGPVAVAWDGLDDEGRIVPEGDYRPRVHLRDAHRTIELPNPIRVDTTPPEVLSVVVRPRVFSPDGDRRRDGIVVRYRLSEEARAVLYVAGEQRVETKFARTEYKLEWYGRASGRSYSAGEYGLAVAARDPAGNLGERRRAGGVTIRYVALGRARIEAVAGRPFSVDVHTDAASVRWRFAGGSRSTSAGRLVLRAPRRPGFYTLFVEANGHAARARVVVMAP